MIDDETRIRAAWANVHIHNPAITLEMVRAADERIKENQMITGRCKDCRHWLGQPQSYGRFGVERRECWVITNGSVHATGPVVMPNDGGTADLLTPEHFGCTLFQAKDNT